MVTPKGIFCHRITSYNVCYTKLLRETKALAESVEDNGGVYLIPAFSGLGAPHWKMDAKGSIVGLTFVV